MKSVDKVNSKKTIDPKQKRFSWFPFGERKSTNDKQEPVKVSKKKQNKRKKNQSKVTENRFLKFSLKIVFIIILATLLTIITFAGAVYAYQDQFEGRALYGAKIFGEEMGGLNQKEIYRKVNEALDNMNFRFFIDGTEVVATPQELGITYQADVTAKNVYKLGRDSGYYQNLVFGAVSLIYRINNPAGVWLAEGLNYGIRENVTIDYVVDNATLDTYTQSISQKFENKSQDAGLIIKGEDIKVVPAIYGRAVAAESIKSQVKEALAIRNTPSIQINVTEVRPDIIESEVASSVAATKKIINLPVKYSYSGKTYTPSKEIIGSWIIFKKSGNLLAPSVDAGKVAGYLDGVAKGINIATVSQKVKVINQGQREVTQEGKNGLAVDVKTASNKTANSLNGGQGITLPLTTYVVKYKTEVNNILVANWDKYIEIDISSQQMCAYLSGGEKVNCWAITTGRSGWATPVGTFLIRSKAGAGGTANLYGSGGGVCMPNPPSTEKLCGINYVSTFTAQGHAIHEAWWRRYPGDYNYFGNPNYRYNGSHGCINSPYDVAKFIYYWAPIGTPVVIHY